MAEPPQSKRMSSATWAVREVDHLFSKLGRYTRFVLYSKWFLGVFAFALLTSLIAWPLLTKDRSGIRMSFIDNTVKPGQKASSPVMSNPEYRGSNAAGEQFKVNGVKATQISQSLAVIDQVEAQMLRKNGGWLSLTADKAEYHQDAKKIELISNVTVIDDRGYSFITSRATIDTKTNDTYGNESISGTGPLGNVLASGFEIRDKGAHIIFKGGTQRVQLHIDRAKKKR